MKKDNFGLNNAVLLKMLKEVCPFSMIVIHNVIIIAHYHQVIDSMKHFSK
jgi:hypothetical protein